MKSKETQKRYNLPSEVIYCAECTISNQRPRITFDENGVCSACNYAKFKQNEINWDEREKELMALCDRFRRNDGRYDVIVPSSGGKDSAFVAHELKHKFGMNVLTVTWSPHLYTEIGWENFQSLIHTGDLPNVLGTPAGGIHRKLTKLSFEILGDPFQPFIYGQTNYPLQCSVNYDIPLVMYGENGEVEYGGNMKNAFKPTRDAQTDHKDHYFSGLSPEDLVKYGINKNDIVPYMAPENVKLKETGTEIHFYGYYRMWVPQENFYYCSENTGFKVNPERTEGTYSKYASIDDKLDGFHFYLAYIKFGNGRCVSDTAHEIRDGHITREEGIKLIEKYDGEFPQKYFKTFLEYCGITEEYFNQVIDSWRSPHLWGKDQEGNWKLKHKISKTGLNDK